MGLDVLLEKKRVYGDISIHEARMGLDDKYHDKALELYKISIHEARMGLDLARTSTIAP